jgi:ankyrin repeat protein
MGAEEGATRLAVTDALLTLGADPDAMSGPCEFPLNFASTLGDTDLVRRLLAAGASATGAFALLYAVGGNHLEIVQLLLDAGADPNQEARSRSRLPFLSDLLNDPTLVTPGGRAVTPLGLASTDDMRALLRSAGAN